MSQTLPVPPSLLELSGEGPLALFVDFDGTLVEISTSPDAITVPSDLGERLSALSTRLEGRLALVSGRALADLDHHIGSLRIACAGSHGADLRDADGATLGAGAAGIAGDVIAEVSAFAAERGLFHERKPHGTALHWRTSPALEDEAGAFMVRLAKNNDLLVKRGKSVAELVCPGIDKGAAVRTFLRQPPFRDARPIFVGDDITDEDGFRAAAEAGGFGILVGERADTAADYALADVTAVHHWLWP